MKPNGCYAYRAEIDRASESDARWRRTLDALDHSWADDEEMRRFFGPVLQLSAASEDLGGQTAERLLCGDLPRVLRARVVRAVWDEIRHSDVFDRLTEGTEFAGERESSVLPDVVDAAESTLEVAIVHTELEALALNMFTLIARSTAARSLGSVYGAISKDEAAHVRLGGEIISYLAGVNASRADVSRHLHLFDLAARTAPVNDGVGFRTFCELLGLPELETADDLRRKQRLRRERIASMLRRGGE